MKSVLISGGSSGIGFAAAKALAAQNWRVTIMGRDEEKGRKAAAEIKNCVFARGDVTNTDDCRKAARTAAEAGDLFGVVTSAGIYEEKLLSHTSDEEIEEFFAVNVYGTMKVIRESLPYLHQGGSIVTIASDAALQGNVQCSLYGATKGAVLSFSRSLALEMAVDGIRVNTVCPGDIRTPLLEKQMKEYGGSEKEMAEWYPLMRIGNPEEVGAVIAFLLSDQSSFITGAAIPVDGGLTDW